MKENRTGAQIIEFLTKRVNALGAKQCGTFLVDCETYASIPQLGELYHSNIKFGKNYLKQNSCLGVQRTLHVFHNSEQPASVFAILDNGTGKTVPVVADALFDLLLLKMSSVYTSKKSKVEIRGPRFELNDFVIKIGAININHNVKGIIVEVINNVICLMCLFNNNIKKCSNFIKYFIHLHKLIYCFIIIYRISMYLYL